MLSLSAIAKAKMAPEKRQRPKPIHIDAGSDSYMINGFKIDEELKKNQIPQSMLEELRLVQQGDSTDGDMIIAYVKKILDRLSMATTGKPCPELRIMLSDQLGDHTGIMTKLDPPVLLIGLSHIDSLIQHNMGEDHLAGVLAHERFHLMCARKWKDLPNTRPQEAIGDIFGTIEAKNAGYNPQALVEFFQSFLKDEYTERRERVTFWGRFAEAIAIHPPVKNRIRNIQMAISNFQLTEKLQETYTPFPQEIIEAVARVEYIPPYEKLKADNNFSKMTSVQKLKFLHGYMMEQLERRDYENPYGDKKRMEPNIFLMAHRLFETYHDISGLWGKPGVQDAAAEILDQLMQYDRDGYHRQLDDMRKWVMRRIIELTHTKRPNPNRVLSDRETEMAFTFALHEHRLSGRYNSSEEANKEIPKKYTAHLELDGKFWRAKTFAGCAKTARAFLAAEQAMEKYRTGLNIFDLGFERTSWPSRHEIRSDLKHKGFCRLPWHNQIGWVLQNPESEDAQIIKAVLKRLGCDDPRLKLEEEEGYWRSRNDYQYEDLTFAADGSITALKPNRYEMNEIYKDRFQARTYADLLAKEHKTQIERVARETELAGQTNWGEMEADFWAFTEKHLEALLPDHTIIDTAYPFAEEFMAQLNALCEKDAKKWKPVLTCFISGVDADRPKKKNKHGDVIIDEKIYEMIDSRAVRKFSMPWLIWEYQTRHFGHDNPYDLDYHHFDSRRGKLSKGHPRTAELAALETSRHDDALSYREDRDKVPHDEELVETYIAIGTNHPFLGPLLALPEDGPLHTEAKANLISNFSSKNVNAATREDYIKIDPYRAFNFPPVKTAEDYSKLNYHAHSSRGFLSVHPLWGNATGIELIRMLRANLEAKRPKRFNLSLLNAQDVTQNFSQLNNTKLRHELKTELAQLVERTIESNKQIDFANTAPVTDIITTFIKDMPKDAYSRITRRYNCFDRRPLLEMEYLDHIRQRIEILPLAERKEPLAQLLSVEIKDPEYRAWATDTWISSATNALGKDDGSEEYTQQAMAIINEAAEKMTSSQALPCMLRLLDIVEGQKALSFGLKEKIIDVYGANYLRKDVAARLIESTIDAYGTSRILRDAFLEYITSPLSDNGTDSFIAISKTNIGDKESPFYQKMTAEGFTFTASPKDERAKMDYLYKNFWALPFEIRTIYLDRILFPTTDTKGEYFGEAVNFVLDKVLPLNRKFAAEAREALVVYLDCCPQELRRATFSAILATTEEVAKNHEMRPGQVLSDVLTRMGAAGGQLLQAAHSYLSSLDLEDPDLVLLRDDLLSSKTNFSRPMRWDMFKRIDDTLSEQERDNIDHVGQILGCGSTAYVVACDKKDGRESALKLMRENVVPVAELQFERFLEAFRILAERHEKYAALPDMVAHAQELIKTSTRGDIAAEQVLYAQNSFNRMTVTVNGTTYNFQTAALHGYGAEFLDTDIIRGEYINKLEAREGKNVCIALKTALLYQLLTGQAIDLDRHSGQQLAQGNTIGIFDVGALPYDVEQQMIAVPSNDEKIALGKLLGIIMNAALAGQSPATAMVQAVTKMEWGTAREYLVGINKALLAQSEIDSGLGDTPAERQAAYKAILMTIWNTSHIDPAILQGLAQTLDAQHIAQLTLKADFSAKATLDVQIHLADEAPALETRKDLQRRLEKN